jgi:dipeptidyl aminopeptidase/acylaminoacyl peptidase
MSRYKFASSLLVAIFCTFSLGMSQFVFAQTQKTSLLPIDQFTQFPMFSSVTASPDGKLLAAVAPTGKRRGLLVWNIETGRGTVIAHYNDMDVNGISWVNNKRLTYSLLDLQAGLGEQIGSGFFAVDIDGKNQVELSSITGQSDQSVGIYRGFGFSRRVGKDFNEDEIYAGKVGRSIDSVDIYRLNTRTGKSVLITNDSPGFVSNWIISKDEKTTVATTYDDNTGKIYVKVKRGGSWVTISEFDRDDQGWTPLSFDPEKKDNNTLIILTNRGRDTTAVARYDLTTDKITDIIAEHPRFDLGWPADEGSGVATPTLNYDIDTDAFLGIRVALEKETTIWLNATFKTYQNTIDKGLPNRVNRISSLGKTGDLLIYSYSDRQPGEYFVYSPSKKTLKEVFSTRPWIKEELMAEQRFITYTARDGRKISAYITIPNNSNGKPAPLVVHPHGGPWLRSEYFGWDPEPQFFASRGYMVIQPEYRGAKGFGYAHYAAGFKQWGLTMQDDLTDGVMHLVKEGLVDKNKVCIAGGSYGGFAVAIGLVKDPDLYKCGINVVGVTASQYMNEVTWTDFSRSKSVEKSLHRVVGHPKTDAAVLAAGNAVDQAEKIKAPMLMLYGLQDRRVPLINGERMRDAMKKHGKKHEWIVYKEEGHGFLLQENRLDYYTRMQNFLAENLK